MILLYSFDANSSSATSIHIHSTDTYVLFLAIRRYPMPCEDTCFVGGIGQKRSGILLRTIYWAPHQQGQLSYLYAMPSGVVISMAKKTS